MTMVNVFFRMKNENLTVEEIMDAIDSFAGYSEVRKIPEFNGEVGVRGGPAIRVYLHISSVADLVEMMEKGIGAELLLAW